MTERSDSLLKTPKSSFKQLDEIAQKNRVTVRMFNDYLWTIDGVDDV